jgi:DNA polymerase (family 10)
MELHEENPFKIRGYQGALNSFDRGDQDLMSISDEDLGKIPGVGKSVLEAIQELKSSDSFPLLDQLIEKTPAGILEILQIKGLGPKKVKTLWEELGITSTHELMEACQSGKVAKIKGFGEKTQDTIIQNLEFKASNTGKWLYADIEEVIENLTEELKAISPESEISIVGDFARKMEIISEAEWLIGLASLFGGKEKLKTWSRIEWDLAQSGPFSWRGKVKELDLHVQIHFCAKPDFIQNKLALTASKAHLALLVDEKESITEKLKKKDYKTEEEFFAKNGLQFIPVEMREGFDEVDLARVNKIPVLLEEKDLRGILHNHSTYSDGKHTLRQMAEYCKELGYDYLGISDHSRTAFYAGGLEIERIEKQQKEIDQLNKELAPFRIFKGIESDILSDGSLDYPENVLASFDFIVASVHSILNMDIKRATERLLRAIENPFTTILGHPTGRLLLRREGYPIDHKTIIDACAKNNVVIEINANPWRLDLDWRWVRYAMEQGVMLSINPDAHEMDGYADMKYGVLVGRKGGLTKKMTLNSLSGKEIAAYFAERKAKIGK